MYTFLLKLFSKVNQLSKKQLYFCVLIICLLPFSKIFLGMRFTGWDTFDVHTINFIFFSDSLRAGIIPLWNPFAASGLSFISNIFTAHLFGPLDLILALFSLVISPNFLVELSVLLGIGFTLSGNYKILRYFNTDRLSAFNGGLVSSLLLLLPVTGQISFLYSFAFLSWISFFCLQNKVTKPILISFFLSALFIKGYFYYNVIALSVALIISLYHYKNDAKNLHLLLIKSFFFIIPLTLFVCLYNEAISNFTIQCSEFLGDLKIEEPRLRLLRNTQQFFYSDVLRASASLTGIIKGGWWTFGFHILTIPVIFAFVFFFRKGNSKFSTTVKLGFFTFFMLGILLSSKKTFLRSLIEHLPVFSSQRWHFTNLYFSIWIGGLILGFSSWQISKTWGPKFKYFREITLFLFFILTLYWATKNLPGETNIKNFPQGYSDRNTNVEWTENSRRLNNKLEFAYNDYSWVIKKSPMSHGYNNSISIYYWYLKDMPFNSKFITSTCNLRGLNLRPRDSFNSDNDYVNSKISQIAPWGDFRLIRQDLANELNSSFCDPGLISNISINPNKIRFNSSSKTKNFIAIQNIHKPGWTASIDNTSTSIEYQNIVFQGIFVPAGEHTIQLTYWPLTATLILIWYTCMLVLISIEFLKREKKQ